MSLASGQTKQQLLHGIELFNAQRYWHAHEAWEQVWLHAPEPQATLYKGLIQTAAALVHWQRGNPRGLVLNWAKAQPKLQQIDPLSTVINLPALIGAMESFVAAHDAGAVPPCIVLVDVNSISNRAAP
jgi:uncharacterized protein